MLSLRIPFGAERQNAPAPRLTLGFGTSWQDAVGLANLAGYRFVPSAEAGFTLSGEPVLQLGPIDLLRELRAAANEGAGETTGGGYTDVGVVGRRIGRSRHYCRHRFALRPGGGL